jgi:2-amino-4-hydroxy-6-hydroxymethyldihydropteridine diphosphokinase
MGEPTAVCYLGLGSNLGNRLAYLRRAYRALGEEAGLSSLRPSSVYESAPVGLTQQPDFLNLVVAANTTLGPEELLDCALRVEADLGRQRTIRWGPRVIDIDVLLIEGQQYRSERLQVPHPRLHERAFVLAPLRELGPELKLSEIAVDETGVRPVMGAATFLAGVRDDKRCQEGAR